MSDRKDLAELAKRIPERYVHNNPSGYGSYVAHHFINQRLLSVVGPFDFECVDVIRGSATGRGADPLVDVVVGVIARLTVQIDGRTVRVEEAGDCENPSNWPHDGARMKDAMSDAFKRCAMRIGLGLHLWAQDEYWLDKFLASSAPNGEAAADEAGS